MVCLEFFNNGLLITPFLNRNGFARVHYIPISQSYRELYNIYAFFSGPTQSMLGTIKPSYQPSNQTTLGNDHLLQKIAQDSRRWKQTTARKVDMEGMCSKSHFLSPPLCFYHSQNGTAYVYRLCLEYARLWADDRESMSMK